MKQKILVFGTEGMIGSRFLTLMRQKFFFHAPTEKEVNLLDEKQLASSIQDTDAEIVLNFAAYTNVGQAEEEKDNREGIVYKLNAEAVKNIAANCIKSSKRLVQISTEYVFDGEKTNGLYKEDDQPNPINWYGQTKYFGEEFVKNSGCKYSIVRICMPYCANFSGKKDIVRTFLAMLQSKQEISALIDVINTPTFVDDIVNGLGLVIENRRNGIIHISARDSISPYDFARLIAQKFELDENLIKPTTFDEFIKDRKAPLLKNSGLDSSKFQAEFGDGILHTIEQGLELLKKQSVQKKENR